MIQSRGRRFRGPLIKVSNWALLKHKDGYKFGTRSDGPHVRMNIFIVFVSRVYSRSGFHVLWHTLYFLSFSCNILNLLRVLRELTFIVALTAQTMKINETTRSNHLLRTFVWEKKIDHFFRVRCRSRFISSSRIVILELRISNSILWLECLSTLETSYVIECQKILTDLRE